MRDIFSRFRTQPTPGGLRFGYAVVGLGHIADYFIKGLRESPTCAVTALVSGSASKASALASKHHILHSGTYADFEAICQKPDVDAVYLALPVSMHREFTERAAAAGKHVLCEKPMAPNAADARAMIAACAAGGVKLSIAYRCPHHPLHDRLRTLLRAKVLGDKSTLRIESGFGFYLKPGWRDNVAQGGGGSLYDVGIYPLNASRYLLEEEPSGVDAVAAVCDAAGLEREIEWTSTFPSGAKAVCRSSYNGLIPDTLRITGERGSLLLAPAFSHQQIYRLQGEFRAADTGKLSRIDEKTPRDLPSEFRLEAEQFAGAVAGTLPLLTPGEDGLADMIAMEQIYRAGGVKLPSSPCN